MTATSFKPLSRKRYRCSVTLKIVKQGSLAAHRRWLAGRDKQPPPAIQQWKPTRPSVQVRMFADETYVWCPRCYAAHEARVGQIIPCGCGVDIEVRRQPYRYL